MSKSPSETVSSTIDWFRQAAPYIQRIRESTLVLSVTDAVLHQTGSDLLTDIAMLNQLGARIVLVHGIRKQLDQALQAEHIDSEFHGGRRVTPLSAIPAITAVIGRERFAMEAVLSSGSPNLQTMRTKVVTGNYISARPYGVHDGVDFQQTGLVRKVDAPSIHAQLDQGSIVLLSPVGYSPSGELFNLRHEDLATEVAVALRADKLIHLLPNGEIKPLLKAQMFQLSPQQSDALVARRPKMVDVLKTALGYSADACRRGVQRCHLLDASLNGSLIKELFSRDGCGTMITTDGYDGLRRANTEDLLGIEQLIQPLVKTGALLPRAREQLEKDLHHYTVIERDGLIVACAAMFQHPTCVELACLATHASYRNAGHAENLLKHICTIASQQNAKTLFVLTTQTSHWFMDRGFKEGSTSDLPIGKRELYNHNRKSIIMLKAL